MRVPEKTNAGMLISKAGSGVQIVKNVAPLGWSIERCVDDGEIAHLPL